MEQIAIVGMAALFPGAADLDQYWQNLIAGRACISDVPPDRFDELFYDPQNAHRPDRFYCRRGGFLEIILHMREGIGLAWLGGKNRLGRGEPAQRAEAADDRDDAKRTPTQHPGEGALSVSRFLDCRAHVICEAHAQKRAGPPLYSSFGLRRASGFPASDLKESRQSDSNR